MEPLFPGRAPAPAADAQAGDAERLRAYLMTAALPLLRQAPKAARLPAVPEGLVDVRRAAPSVLLLPAPPWSDPIRRFMLRPEVAARLEEAARALPSDLRLGFWEGWRPLAVQRALWETSLAFFRSAYPAAGQRALEALLERYVARPDGPAPPHTTGSAVDVAPVDAFGRVLGPGDAWGKLAVDTLARALRRTGLANYEPEWWHWSYGDAEWARAYDCAPLAFSSAVLFEGPGDGI